MIMHHDLPTTPPRIRSSHGPRVGMIVAIVLLTTNRAYPEGARDDAVSAQADRQPALRDRSGRIAGRSADCLHGLGTAAASGGRRRPGLVRASRGGSSRQIAPVHHRAGLHRRSAMDARRHARSCTWPSETTTPVPALYRIPIDGGESQQVVVHDDAIRGFAISPDGKRIAFLATDPIDKATKEVRDKGFDQEIYEEDTRMTKVWLTDATGTATPQPLELPGSASDVQWSPSGQELLVVLAPTRAGG